MTNNNDEATARKIIRHLDQGTRSLRPEIEHRLQVARQNALEKYNPQPSYGLAWAVSVGVRSGYTRLLNFRLLMPMLALVMGLAGAVYWQNVQNAQRANELLDIDTGLLSDDLPLHAYLDNGLDAWLKRSPQ